MKRFLFFGGALLFLLTTIITGCKSPSVVTDTVDHDIVEESVFSARQDTVTVRSYRDEGELEETPAAGSSMFYTVQVGAFKQPENAERAHRTAQRRFQLETSTDYDTVEELYKITVGQFLTYDQARAFCDRIMRDYPRDYYDAWVVELSQRQRRPVQ